MSKTFKRGDKANVYHDWVVANCKCGLDVNSFEAHQLEENDVILFKCPDPSCGKIFARVYVKTLVPVHFHLNFDERLLEAKLIIKGDI